MQLFEADLTVPEHASAVVFLLNSYACSPEGGEKPLPDDVQCNLARTLHQRSDTIVVLAFDDDEPAGLVICMEGFSTFACKPLLNIHDVFVAARYQGQALFWEKKLNGDLHFQSK